MNKRQRNDVRQAQNLTSQGVKDLNGMGPRKPNPEAGLKPDVLTLNAQTCGGGHKPLRRGLPDADR
jgi:hypothetical protein